MFDQKPIDNFVPYETFKKKQTERAAASAQERMEEEDRGYEELDIEIGELLSELEIERTKPRRARNQKYMHEIATRLLELFKKQDEIVGAAYEQEDTVDQATEIQDKAHN